VRPEDARRATTEHIASAVEWLIDEKVRLEASAFPEPVTDKEGARP
jgi:hypothetical protein